MLSPELEFQKKIIFDKWEFPKKKKSYTHFSKHFKIYIALTMMMYGETCSRPEFTI